MLVLSCRGSLNVVLGVRVTFPIVLFLPSYLSIHFILFLTGNYKAVFALPENHNLCLKMVHKLWFSFQESVQLQCYIYMAAHRTVTLTFPRDYWGNPNVVKYIPVILYDVLHLQSHIF